MQMRRLDTSNPRLRRRVAVFEVIDVGMAGEAARAVYKAVGDITEMPHLIRGEDIRHNNGTNFIVFVNLWLCEHALLLYLAQFVGAFVPMVQRPSFVLVG